MYGIISPTNSSATDRLILHCDLNNFYASVECVNHPEWRNIPLAVSGNPEKRHGIILAKNDLAKAKGVKTGEAIWQAKQREPNLLCVPPHFDQYMKFSKIVFDIYSTFTNLVEPFGADECWLDCTGSIKLFGSGREIADKIRSVVYEKTGLTISVGVSFNKIFAKLGSDMKKPNATTEITRQNFRDKIWQLPAQELMMVGSATTKKLNSINIFTIGDLAHADIGIIKNMLGINGVKLVENANGNNYETVREYVKHRLVESVGHGMTAVRDITNIEDASCLLYYLADLVATRLRKNHYKGYGVSIDIRDLNLHHQSRQTKLNAPTYTSTDIACTCIELLKTYWDMTKPIRTLTISVFDLVDDKCDTQATMFDEIPTAKKENLEKTLDHLRSKYGYNILTRANLIEKDFIYDKTDAEDFLAFQR